MMHGPINIRCKILFEEDSQILIPAQVMNYAQARTQITSLYKPHTYTKTNFIYAYLCSQTMLPSRQGSWHFVAVSFLWSFLKNIYLNYSKADENMWITDTKFKIVEKEEDMA